jgi:multidrug efflux pump subunit AcrA (membrane-fusion protein)
MLNLSNKSIDSKIDKSKYSAFALLERQSVSKMLIRIIIVIFILTFLAMFLPWTQNIRSKGYVTTLYPDDRPQNVQALIGGRIEQWYVREGQIVQKGDTIILISEVKEEYLDPDILARTNSQIFAKNESANAYDEKAQRLSEQLSAINNSRLIKLQQNEIKLIQTKLKLQSDSIDLVAAELNREIAEKQLLRMSELYDAGLKSLTELETKKLSLQEYQAKVISLENKVNMQRNELINLTSNTIGIENEYQDKIAKAQSERMSAVSDKYEAEATVNKLQSQYNSYAVRQNNYYIKSPINGIVTKAIKYGLGEIIKNGDDVISIMPETYQLAVEMYVEPRDMPLLDLGQKVRVQFDGWPAIVFSGWPDNSFGTFGGKVFAIDNFISDNGKYRILVAPDPDDSPWPKEVRVGGGANTITLLRTVKIGYEIWRQLNGFPPDYYKMDQSANLKTKAPLSKVK